MPVATTYSNGANFVIYNTGANSFSVTDSASGAIGTAAVGNTYYLTLTSNATAAGTWIITQFGGAGVGTVTSVAMTVPSVLSVSGSPVTTTGTLAVTLATQTANTIFAGPTTGSAAAPTFRAMVAADMLVMVGDSGSGGTKGAVPAPAAGDAAGGKYLSAGGTWATPGGTGASTSDTFVVISAAADLSNERVLTSGTGITITDAGAGSTVTISVSNPLPSPSASATYIPRVNSGATAYELRTPTQTRGDISAAVLGANSDITSLTGLTTPLADTYGGTGLAALGSGVATFLGTPSSANLASAVTGETGSGALVFATSPTLITPTIGAATATTINGLTITASTGVLTIVNGKTLNCSNTLAFTGTDGSSMACGTGGTIVYTGVTLTAAGLVTGGGDLSSNRTFTVSAATQAEQETGSSTAVAVTPGRQQYHASAAKVWCNYAMNGTANGSYNVASVSDGGTGLATINYSVNFSSTNYAVHAAPCSDPAASAITTIISQCYSSGHVVSSQSIAIIELSTFNLADVGSGNFIAFGDQ